MDATATRPFRPPPGLSPRVSATEVGVAATIGNTILRKTNESLQESCEGLSRRCVQLEDDLKQSRLREKFLQDRLYHPDDGQQLAMKVASAEAEAAELRRILTESSQKKEQLSQQTVKLQWQLAMSRDAEKAQRASMDKLRKEFQASRLALLVRMAQAQAERDAIERDANRLREWAISAMEGCGLDPRDVEGYEEAFIRRPGPAEKLDNRRPRNYEQMFDPEAFDVGGASRFVPREVPNDYLDPFDPGQLDVGGASVFVPAEKPKPHPRLAKHIDKNYHDMFDPNAFDVGGASAFVPHAVPKDYFDPFDPEQLDVGGATEFVPGEFPKMGHVPFHPDAIDVGGASAFVPRAVPEDYYDPFDKEQLDVGGASAFVPGALPKNYKHQFDREAFDVGGASRFVPREVPERYHDVFDEEQLDVGGASRFVPGLPPSSYTQMFVSPQPLGDGESDIGGLRTQ